jgi:hypothetical protein
MPEPPSFAKNTGTEIMGVKIYTDDILLPNCSSVYVMSGVHTDTKEPGWFAFCKKSGKLEQVGPYETYSQAIKYLNLTKGCKTCELNKSENKEKSINLIDEKVREELEKTLGVKLHSIPEELRFFVEYRSYFDINFDAIFKSRFFVMLPDDFRAVLDILPPCTCEKDFTTKVCALAGLLDRINENEIRKLIGDKEKQNLSGSINILEQILKENYPKYSGYLISNLKSLMNLRNKMYPTHALSAQILVALQNFGITNYPLDDWEDGWLKILGLCSKSMDGLVKLLQASPKSKKP